MADYHFARATSWAELHAVHQRFFHDYNEQPHWAHRERSDGRHSPQAVLGPLRTAWCDPADLDRLFRVRVARRVDAGGYLRYVHWRPYGERSLAGAQAAVWMLGETVTVAYGTDALAQYAVAFEPDGRHIRDVAEAHLVEYRYPSPQPFLPALTATEWRLALRLERRTRQARLAASAAGEQLPLFEGVE